MSLRHPFDSDAVAVGSNLVYYLSRTLYSLAGSGRGRQLSTCLGPDLALFEATSLKGPVQERRGADRRFGAYQLLYVREGERTRPSRTSRSSRPALTALDACGAICAALRGLGQPQAAQPHGAHTSKLGACLRWCCASSVSASSGRRACRGRVARARGAFLVFGRRSVGRGCSGHCSA